MSEPSPFGVISESASPEVSKQVRKIDKRTKIITEILETERSYVRDMQTLVSIFMNPLQTLAQTTEKPVLTKMEITIVFSIADQLVL